MLNQIYVDDIIKRALLEDINYLDISSDFLFGPDHVSRAQIIAKDEGILCGLPVFLRVFELLDPTFSVEAHKKEGDPLKKGDLIAEFGGSTLMLLKGERTALNLIQHMSGIASQTAQIVEAVAGTRAQIADTRKTLPGLRALQKYAVAVGGGKNHRFNLSDAAMLKDNHIDAAGSITRAVEILRSKLGHMVKIEVETRNLEEVKEALATGVEVIMLDNMTNETMKAAVDLVSGRALLEASGGITLERIREVAKTGVDLISLGSLTHSVKAFDISMKIV